MTTESDMPVATRIYQLLQHLGLEQAHFATRSLGDLTGLAAQRPELFASLTLVGPAPPNPEIVGPLSDRLLVFRGDTPGWDELDPVVNALPGAALVTLHNWEPWSDMITRHAAEIRPAILPFLAANTAAAMPAVAAEGGEQGVIAGISYHLQGSGPPLVLLPLGLVPSQWDALMPDLTRDYCTITLGGAELGMAFLLEKRALEAGYLGMVKTLVQTAEAKPGDAVLEVGCGTGALTRWLARDLDGRKPVTGVDINRYLLREAADLARAEGLADRVLFEEADAEDLPYPDNAFDLTLSVTVFEEVDADKTLAEMIRVTRPGGSVAVIVRAKDVPFFINLPLSPALKAKVENPELHGAAAGANGCADVSLYRRFQAANLVDVKMFPHLAAFSTPLIQDFLQGTVMPILNQAEAAEWRAARAQAEAEGTFFWSYPHHCAVGTVPG